MRFFLTIIRGQRICERCSNLIEHHQPALYLYDTLHAIFYCSNCAIEVVQESLDGYRIKAQGLIDAPKRLRIEPEWALTRRWMTARRQYIQLRVTSGRFTSADVEMIKIVHLIMLRSGGIPEGWKEDYEKFGFTSDDVIVLGERMIDEYQQSTA